MTATNEIPDDTALPALAEIRAAGLARALAGLGVEDCHLELMLRGYSPGSRATIEARTGPRRFAVKAYGEDPSTEAELYEALAAAGVAGSDGARVPPLLAWNRELRLLVIGWLEGPTAQQLVEEGQGKRAGELAARWLQRVATLPVKLGPPFGAARMLHRARKWVVTLSAADPGLGTAAATLLEMLAGTQPEERNPRLVHSTFYARHLLDLDGGPGVIDWQRFGQGPVELDAGMFLASVWRSGLRQNVVAMEAARAEEAFLAGTATFLNERALAWHRAAALLRLADKLIMRQSDDWLARAHSLL